jgi:intracellular multiplication protein IcmK
MKNIGFLASFVLATCAHTFAQAQPQPMPTNASARQSQQGTPPQPKSNLGKQAPGSQQPPEVVIPRAPDVVEQSIEDIEGTQLSDDQYERIKKLFLRRERQKSTPYVSPAKPVIRTLMVALDPGISPPILRVTRGQLTSVVFSDMAGQPWQIKDVGLNRKMFSDGREGAGALQAEPTNVLTIEPLSAAAFGNVAVRLKGLATPVIFVLAAAQQEVDMRVDAKVPGRNPDSGDTVSYTSMPAIDVSLTGFLDGVPPKEARRLRVTGLPKTEAWLYQENLYVRTDADAQYPAYFSSARSTSGRAVYRFNARQNSITLLANGRAVTVFIED